MLLILNSMLFKFLPQLIIFWLLFFFLSISNASFSGYRCGSVDSSPSSTKFQTNLKLLLSSLTSNQLPSTSGFYSTNSVGENPDRVYALVLCKGNVTSDNCIKSLGNIANGVIQRCINGTQGIVWYNHCLVRYSSRKLFGEMQLTDRKSEPLRMLAESRNSSPTVHRQVCNITAKRCFSLDPPATQPSGQTSSSLPPSIPGPTTYGISLPPSIPVVPITGPPPTTLPLLMPTPGPTSEIIHDPKNGEHLSPRKKKSFIIGGAILGSLVSMATIVLLFFLYRRKSSSNKPFFFWNKRTHYTKDVETFLKNNRSLAPKRYNYSELKKMTNSFREKIGQGGYGEVFKGKLLDGVLVAVKVLSESKGNGQEFINEVASIGKTYHVNVVSLLGFCFEGSKRALIYEYMPNGSLDKYIYGQKPRNMNPLGWEKLFQIALDIARGLEYLHLRCSTRILHLDIKPHNILLDQDFRPKISDFGLAKLCLTQESAISKLTPRGTFGYTAPEVHCRNFGGVSYKSDVYSYGMMVLEMVGGRKNIDVGVATSEIYFPQWIYKHFNQQESRITVEGLTTGAEEEMTKKMILVGLWCIQIIPLDRPSMSRVVEMFQGSIESLQMPPNPFSSPPSMLDEVNMHV